MLYLAFITGLLGSFHCVGMCGPIALALPINNEHSIFRVVTGRVIYNLGRVITYSVLGLVFGLFGAGIHLAGLQQVASVLIGIVVLAIIVNQYFINGKTHTPQWINNLTNPIKRAFSRFYSKDTYSSLLTIGILNGLLPCGFVYIGIAGSLTTDSAIDGALYMGLFGLGTLPMMLFVSIGGKFMPINFRKRVSKASPVLMLAVAVLLMLRGLNLGIPYISPEVKANNTKQTMECCTKPHHQ